MIRTFLLIRHKDETGVSGPGVVAAGMEYPDGHVTMRWLVGEHKSSVCWDSIESVRAIHGHNGKTEIKFVGGINPWSYASDWKSDWQPKKSTIRWTTCNA